MTGAELYTLYTEVHGALCDPWDMLDVVEQAAWNDFATELNLKGLS